MKIPSLTPGIFKQPLLATATTPLCSPGKIAYLFVALLLALPASHAADKQAEQLETLRKQITEVQRDQGLNQQQQKTLNQQLKKFASQIDDLGSTIAQLQKSRRTEQARIIALEGSQAELQQRLRKHKKLLGHLARRAYLNGQQEYLKLLLNQQDPADIQRMLGYYRYLQQAQVTEITEVKETILQLHETQQQLAATKQAVANTLKKIQQQKSTLASQQKKQRAVLSQLMADFQDNESQLVTMRKNESRLAKLVEQLQKNLDDIPETAGQSFTSARGTLEWPAAGKLKHRFGEKKPQSEMRWQGVLIDTPVDSQVHAVHAGRIAFADWLRGFGLLVIIDHGDDYMTIYGHNQAIQRDSGSWVEQGEVIASAGTGGNETESGLYFEIRHRGKPTNPAKWCHH